MWGDIAIAFLLAFITAFMATPYSIRIAKKVGAVDIPKDNRRMHHKPIPRLRWTSSNSRGYYFFSIFINYNVNREYCRFI